MCGQYYALNLGVHLHVLLLKRRRWKEKEEGKEIHER